MINCDLEYLKTLPVQINSPYHPCESEFHLTALSSKFCELKASSDPISFHLKKSADSKYHEILASHYPTILEKQRKLTKHNLFSSKSEEAFKKHIINPKKCKKEHEIPSIVRTNSVMSFQDCLRKKRNSAIIKENTIQPILKSKVKAETKENENKYNNCHTLQNTEESTEIKCLSLKFESCCNKQESKVTEIEDSLAGLMCSPIIKRKNDENLLQNNGSYALKHGKKPKMEVRQTYWELKNKRMNRK